MVASNAIFYCIVWSWRSNKICKQISFTKHVHICGMCVSRMLRSNQISCIDNSTFTGLSSVRLLSLYDNRISSIAPGAFSTLHSLSTMWVISDGFAPCFRWSFVLFPSYLSTYATVSFSLSSNLTKYTLPPFVVASFFISIPLFLCPYLSLSANFSVYSHCLSYLLCNTNTRTHLHTCCSLDAILLTDALHHYRLDESASQDIYYQS